jgi:serine/threonine-protein kinase
MDLTIDELLDSVASALGLEDVAILTNGGRKVVLSATLAGASAIAKIVPIPAGPQGLIAIERSHHEVEVLAAVDLPAVVESSADNDPSAEEDPQAISSPTATS